MHRNGGILLTLLREDQQVGDGCRVLKIIIITPGGVSRIAVSSLTAQRFFFFKKVRVY